jgi:glycosyltransferase involved in cell wall biosynthesis
MKSKIKIFQIVDSLDIGGTERMSVNICNALTASNIENYLVVSRKTGSVHEFVDQKSNVIFLDKRNFLDFYAFIKLFNLVLNYKPTIIHAHQTSIYWIFAIKIFFPNKKIVWHDHWGFSDILKDSDRKIIKFFSFLIDGVVCVNDKIRVWNIRNLKISKDHIIYIPNFPLVRITEKMQNDVPVLLCLANIRDQKDHLNLLEACSLLKKDNINFKLLLAGSLEDKIWVEKVKKTVIFLNLQENVDFLGKVVDISELLSRADVGVLSSVSEGLPVSLLEYGLAGLPVVCTDVGQCKEVLDDGEFGWVVPPKSPINLATALTQAILNTQLAKEKGRKLKNNIDINYGSKGFVKKYLELLDLF